MKYTVIVLVPKQIANLCSLAWQGVWDSRAKKKDEDNFRGRLDYITASDLERMVRHLAVKMTDSRNTSYSFEDWMMADPHGYRFSAPGHHSLNDAVRDWLLERARQGQIHGHNFGRGHISGMRFRPVEKAAMNPTEQETVKRREERRHKVPPRHALAGESTALLCGDGKGPWRGTFRRSARTAKDRKDVTCPRCLALLKSGWARINYGINRKSPHRRGQIEHRNDKAIIPAKWGAEGFHSLVTAMVARRHGKDGWALTGYALTGTVFGPKLYLKDIVKEATERMATPNAEDWIIKAASLKDGDEVDDFHYDFRAGTGITLLREKDGWKAVVA